MVTLGSFMGEDRDRTTSQMLVQYLGGPPRQLAPVKSHKSTENHAHPLKIAKKTEDETFFFPEETIEKIIARVRFPSIFKARLLSKAWRDKFTPPNKSCVLTPLQQEMSSVAIQWTAYSPVFYNWKEIWGFDRVSSQWKSMPPLPQLPSAQYYRKTPTGNIGIPNCVGSLLLVSQNVDSDGLTKQRLFVTNVITKGWRKFKPHIAKNFYIARDMEFRGEREPPELAQNYYIRRLQRYRGPPDMELRGALDFHIKLAIILPGERGDFDTYRLLLLDIDNDYQLLKITYDSSADEWSAVTRCEVPFATLAGFKPDFVYLHGKLYVICHNYVSFKLCVHNIDSDKTWMVTDIFQTVDVINIRTCGIYRCGKRIMVAKVLRTAQKFQIYDLFQIYELDIPSLQLVEVCKGPPSYVNLNFDWKMMCVDSQAICSSDDDFIYFMFDIAFQNWWKIIIRYDLHNGEWDILPSIPSPAGNYRFSLGSAFTPGLNPFAIV